MEKTAVNLRDTALLIAYNLSVVYRNEESEENSATLRFCETIGRKSAETIQLGRFLRKRFDTAYFETLVRICNFVEEIRQKNKKARQLTGSLAQAGVQTRMIPSR